MGFTFLIVFFIRWSWWKCKSSPWHSWKTRSGRGRPNEQQCTVQCFWILKPKEEKVLLGIPYLTSPKHLLHPSRECHHPRTIHLLAENPFAASSDPFTAALPHDSVGCTCQQNIISSRQIVTRCYPVQEEIEMDAESASAVPMNSTNEYEPKGTAISKTKSLCSCFLHTGEEWNQVWWDQQVKSFPCMAGSCTGLCGCKTFPYYQVYKKDSEGLCWWNQA